MFVLRWLNFSNVRFHTCHVGFCDMNYLRQVVWFIKELVENQFQASAVRGINLREWFCVEETANDKNYKHVLVQVAQTVREKHLLQE